MIAIDHQACTGCGLCVEICPTGALRLVGGRVQLDAGFCEECETCIEVCPQEALVAYELVEEVHHPATVSSSVAKADEIIISDLVKKPFTSSSAKVITTPKRNLGNWLGAALNFLVFEIGPAVENALMTEPRQKGRNMISSRRSMKSRGENGGRRRRGRKYRYRMRGRR